MKFSIVDGQQTREYDQFAFERPFQSIEIYVLMPLCKLYNKLLSIVSVRLKFISKVATVIVVWEYLEVVQQSGQADCCFWARGSKMVFRFLTITRDNTAQAPATTLVSSVQLQRMQYFALQQYFYA